MDLSCTEKSLNVTNCRSILQSSSDSLTDLKTKLGIFSEAVATSWSNYFTQKCITKTLICYLSKSWREELLPEIPKFDKPTCRPVSIQTNTKEQLVSTVVSSIDLKEVAQLKAAVERQSESSVIRVISDTLGCRLVGHFFVLTTFWHHLWSITE